MGIQIVSCHSFLFAITRCNLSNEGWQVMIWVARRKPVKMSLYPTGPRGEGPIND